MEWQVSMKPNSINRTQNQNQVLCSSPMETNPDQYPVRRDRHAHEAEHTAGKVCGDWRNIDPKKSGT